MSELGGERPLNIFGGNLGTGRIHGLLHISEGAVQVATGGDTEQSQMPMAVIPETKPSASAPTVMTINYAIPTHPILLAASVKVAP